MAGYDRASGDYQTFGNDPGAKNVYDIDSIQLVKTVADMKNEGVFLSEKPIKVPPRFFVGASKNPFADPVELQLIRLQKKIDAGAQFIQTQTIYDVERFADYMERAQSAGQQMGALPPACDAQIRLYPG